MVQIFSFYCALLLIRGPNNNSAKLVHVGIGSITLKIGNKLRTASKLYLQEQDIDFCGLEQKISSYRLYCDYVFLKI
jgi:hypothetical protein